MPSPGSDIIGCPFSQAGRTQVIYLPDLFASVMDMKNRVNPHYESVKVRSQSFIKKALRLPDEVANKLWAADFAYLTSTWIPDASEDRLYILQLWQLWAFMFDDQFDEGVLSSNPLQAAEEVVNCLALLDCHYPILKEEHASLAFLFQHIWLEFSKTATEYHKYRFKKAHRMYMMGLLRQVTVNTSSEANPTALSFDTYMTYRRDTIAVDPCYVLIEWAAGLVIPQEALDHRSVAACKIASVEITCLDNDIVSLQKDLDLDVRHNAIPVLCASTHCTVQQAVNKISDMLDKRYGAVIAALADPQLSSGQWGAGVDHQIHTMLELYVRQAVGSLHWSFRSGRYFGDKGEEVRATRLMHVTHKE
ncbi:isoprenoid synthase domain-containing protein [Microdochium bolleyi]|uniref:Terpene synthase n=1 Tax=Microdochium bolleyi TaxID=196109 RepID=A0A136IJK9_9PEZI|nr:isoprenoid synthase domain-containing protein [Microdochium bolleyi]